MNKKQADKHEMLYEKGLNWADLDPKWKNGTFIYRYCGNIVEGSKVKSTYTQLNVLMHQIGLYNAV